MIEECDVLGEMDEGSDRAVKSVKNKSADTNKKNMPSNDDQPLGRTTVHESDSNIIEDMSKSLSSFLSKNSRHTIMGLVSRLTSPQNIKPPKQNERDHETMQNMLQEINCLKSEKVFIQQKMSMMD